MAPLLIFTQCTGTFRPRIFANRDVLVCRFCILSNQTATDLQNALQKIDVLSEKVEVLQEITSLIIGTTMTPPETPKVTTAPALQPTTNSFLTGVPWSPEWRATQKKRRRNNTYNNLPELVLGSLWPEWWRRHRGVLHRGCEHRRCDSHWGRSGKPGSQ